jgi:hypothetical protein
MAVSRFTVHLSGGNSGGGLNEAINTYEFDAGLGGQSVAYTAAKLLRMYNWLVYDGVIAGTVAIDKITYTPAVSPAGTIGAGVGLGAMDVPFPVDDYTEIRSAEGNGDQLATLAFPAVFSATNANRCPRGTSMILQRKGSSPDGQGSGRVFLPFVSASVMDAEGVVSQAVGQFVAALVYRYLKGQAGAKTLSGTPFTGVMKSSDPVIQGKKAGIVPVDIFHVNPLLTMLRSRKR